MFAVAAAGLYAGQREPEIRSAETHLQAVAVWDTLVFVLNGLIFILLGLQFRSILAGLARGPAWLLARDAAIIILTVVLVRIVWMVGITGLLSLLRRAARIPVEPLPWSSVPVIAWAGTRDDHIFHILRDRRDIERTGTFLAWAYSPGRAAGRR